jgi:phytoene dehydrogenase-like protein
MNDAHNADRQGKDLVVNGVWEAPQQHPSKTAPNDGVTLGRFLDKADRGINRVEELLRRRR